ncbi:uncharacterized protein LJ206_011999 isoform 1-T8 [Theristicus caerulescens]
MGLTCSRTWLYQNSGDPSNGSCSTSTITLKTLIQISAINEKSQDSVFYKQFLSASVLHDIKESTSYHTRLTVKNGITLVPVYACSWSGLQDSSRTEGHVLSGNASGKKLDHLSSSWCLPRI